MHDFHSRGRPLFAAALAILAILIGASISALVYQSVVVREPCPQTVSQQQVHADIKSTVTFKTENNQEVCSNVKSQATCDKTLWCN